MAPAKLKIPREMKEILGPLKEAVLDYQQALPTYMEAMKFKFPPHPPIDLDCNERRMRESLHVLALKMAAERDEDAVWRRNRDQELAVKAEVIANREDIPNAYRALLREMESANERLRNTQRLIAANRKQMDELRGEMDTMNAWLHSGEPATKEMLRSVGLLKKTCSQPSHGIATSSVKAKDAQRTSTRSTSSWWSDVIGTRTASSRSSASSRHSEPTPSVAKVETVKATVPKIDAIRPSVPKMEVVRPTVATSTTRGARVAPASVTFKTRRAPKLVRAPRRAEYCPVGNKVSFRKKSIILHDRPSTAGSVNTRQPQQQPQQQVVSSSCSCVKPSAPEGGARVRVSSLGAGGNVRAATETWRRNPSEGSAAAATDLRKPNVGGVARAQKPRDEEDGAKGRCPKVAEVRPVVARRAKEAPKVRKRPPWRPMA